MFITKRCMSRRTVLRGMGAAITLPLLEGMVPAQTPLRSTAASPRSRFAPVEIVHGSAGSTVYGIEKAFWSPKEEGANFQFGEIIKPLETLRDYITIVSNTDCAAAMPMTPEEVGADHFRNAAVFLTAAHPKQTLGSDVHCGTSIDQMYAQQFGQDTPVPSIQLRTEQMDATGPCSFKYSCVYMETISWSSPTTPLPMISNPRAAFEELFGSGSSKEERAQRQQLNRSILDGVAHDVARIEKKLGPADRARLNDYLDNVREIERRIQAIEAYNSSGVERTVPTAPVGVPDSWDELVRLMFDLIVAGFAGEATRIAALKISKDVSDRVFPESGDVTPFHSASHHGETPKGIDTFAKINKYHVSLVAYFLDKLRKTPDGDGNLLDHSMVLYGSAMGNSNVHGHKQVPMLLGGRANNTLKGNFHLRCKDETPQANLLLTMVNKLGVDIDSVGDSTGQLEI